MYFALLYLVNYKSIKSVIYLIGQKLSERKDYTTTVLVLTMYVVPCYYIVVVLLSHIVQQHYCLFTPADLAIPLSLGLSRPLDDSKCVTAL